MKKALLFANTDWYLWNFRLPLARELRTMGWEVVLVSPPGPWGERLAAEGFRWLPFEVSRHGMNPVREMAVIARLVALYRRERPDLAHHFTIKCVLYGGLAARMSGVRATVSSVTGLGHVFVSNGTAFSMIRALVCQFYRYVLRGSNVVFQNPDDLAEFERNGVLDRARVHVIRGSGVDTRRFDPGATPAPEPPVKVIVVSRLLREKGIEELVEAARLLRSRGVQARFLVAGDLDPGNPSSFAGPDLERWRLEGVVEFLGHRDDVPELLRAAHIACLPSWREGTPRSLLEAMACGLPIVTTDVPGCREVARNGDNAVLVAPRNPAALAEGLRTLIESPDLRAQMGRRSRQRACTEFSQEQVLERTLAIYSAAMA